MAEPIKKYASDDWIFRYTVYNPPVTAPSSTPVVAPAPAPTITNISIPPLAPSHRSRLNMYAPGEVPVPEISTADLTPCDLTGYQAVGVLHVGNQSPKTVITAAQDAGNLLIAGQFILIVPSAVTATIPAESFGLSRPSTRLQVILVDTSNRRETYDEVVIRVVAP